jgi:hypothetical protein
LWACGVVIVGIWGAECPSVLVLVLCFS